MKSFLFPTAFFAKCHLSHHLYALQIGDNFTAISRTLPRNLRQLRQLCKWGLKLKSCSPVVGKSKAKSSGVQRYKYERNDRLSPNAEMVTHDFNGHKNTQKLESKSRKTFFYGKQRFEIKIRSIARTNLLGRRLLKKI